MWDRKDERLRQTQHLRFCVAFTFCTHGQWQQPQALPCTTLSPHPSTIPCNMPCRNTPALLPTPYHFTTVMRALNRAPSTTPLPRTPATPAHAATLPPTPLYARHCRLLAHMVGCYNMGWTQQDMPQQVNGASRCLAGKQPSGRLTAAQLRRIQRARTAYHMAPASPAPFLPPLPALPAWRLFSLMSRAYHLALLPCHATATDELLPGSSLTIPLVDM